MSRKSNDLSIKHFHLDGIAVLVMIMVGGMATAQINLDETKSIDADMYYQISLTGIEAGDVLNVNVQVTKGDAVDVLLMKSSDYVDYLTAAQSEQGGTFNYYVDGSSNSVKSKTYSFTFPESGDYYIVIDNTDNPIGGANPTGSVDVRAKITVAPPTPESPGFEAIAAGIGIITAIVLRRK